MSILVLFILIVVVAGVFVIANVNRKAEIFRNCMKKHHETLTRKFRQSLYKDDYGNIRYDRWIRERDYFVHNVLALDFPNGIDDIDIDATNDLIDSIVMKIHMESLDKAGETYLGLPDNITPVEFEYYCAEKLIDAGWEARTTKTTGDQGVDIVANLNELKAVFQCKLYSKPVGNSAVQEIAAGRGFEEADLAVVITNNSFTKSARQLAESLSVFLIHYEQIEDFTNDLSKMMNE